MAQVTIGAAIRYLRERSGYSARYVSQEAGLSSSYVSKVEAGSMEPSLRAFCCIAQVLDMSDQELLFLLKIEMKNE